MLRAIDIIRHSSMNFAIKPLGDQGIVILFDGEVNHRMCQAVRDIEARIKAAQIEGVIESVPAFSSVAVYYQPWKVTLPQVTGILHGLVSATHDHHVSRSQRKDIPTCYGSSFGPDLADVAKQHSVSVTEVISLHSGAEYTVAMIGFAPGFPYLLGLPRQLATPRLAQPRPSVPAGSVGIGGSQAGIYPQASPGGWNIIGQTPLSIFDLNRQHPALLQAGDIVRFVAINEVEFDELTRSNEQELQHR
jgi:inhibitor of KinA